MASSLRGEIIGDILRLARDEGWPVGAAVGVKPLAARFGVSRTPVRSALLMLVEAGLLTRDQEGFSLLRPVDDVAVAAHMPAPAGRGELYQRILTERARGDLPTEVTENAMMVHFGAAKGDLRKALMRLSSEGLVQRQRGHGWRFTESLDTPEAILESYAFRIAIETAALSQPGYSVDTAELDRLRTAHEALMRRPVGAVTPQLWFEVNSTFHETLASWSRNRFFLQAVRRQNALRRMHQFADFWELEPEQILQSCRDHLAILAALDKGDRPGAVRLLVEHLSGAARDWEAQPPESSERP
ncbi:GntR family transcriptional regulator [Bosea beijingensis]|jgi:DNA-binding GntR family transcriptional regulator